MIFQLKCQVVGRRVRGEVCVEWIHRDSDEHPGQLRVPTGISCEAQSISPLLDGLLCNKSHNHVTILSSRAADSALNLRLDYAMNSKFKHNISHKYILARDIQKSFEHFFTIISNNSSIENLHNFFFQVREKCIHESSLVFTMLASTEENFVIVDYPACARRDANKTLCKQAWREIHSNKALFCGWDFP